MHIVNLNSELTAIEISGIEAKAYLQGQLTNDINELDKKQFQLSAHLNNKGRIIATFFITSANQECFYLITSKTLVEKIVSRLKMYILRSKVKCQLSNLDIFMSDEPIQGIHSFKFATKQFMHIGQLPDIPNEKGDEWHQLLVTNSIPMIYLDSSEKIIPQQINYDLIGGVNFKKGCYTGQEIVARTHYLGKVKRRMVSFKTDAKPVIGQTITSPKLDNQEVGFIIDFYQTDNKFHGLASIQLDCIDEVYLDNQPSSKLECSQLITE